MDTLKTVAYFWSDRQGRVYPPSQKALPPEGGMNAKRVSANVLWWMLLRRVSPKQVKMPRVFIPPTAGDPVILREHPWSFPFRSTAVFFQEATVR